MLERVVVALLLWPALALADDHVAKPKDPHAEVKAEAKAEAKPPAKAEVKAEAKPEAKAAAKPEPKIEAKHEVQPEAKPAAGDKLAEKLAKDAASAQKAKRSALGAPPVDKKPDATIDSEPGPPPLKMSALQDEARRRGADDETDKVALAKMAAEISAAREALRNETARLEAMLSDVPSGGEAEGAKKQLSSMDAVAKTLRGMKPDQAAAILSRMERKLAVDLLRRIPPVDGAKVLAAMKPELAAELASDIAARGPRAEAKK